MSREERETSAKTALRQDADALAGVEGELHRPPSVMWFLVPLVGIILYALLSR